MPGIQLQPAAQAGQPQPPQGPLVPWPTIDDRFRSPAAIETPQLLEELAGLPQPSFPESLQVEDSPGGWVNGGEDPALTPADLHTGLIDDDAGWQLSPPDRPIAGELLLPVPRRTRRVDRQERSCYGGMGDGRSQSTEELGCLAEGSSTYEAQSVGREGQCDGPARSISCWMRLSILRKLTMLITPIQFTKNRILTAPLT
jgi:hypothetical protein